jgi:hypothetical protein
MRGLTILGICLVLSFMGCSKDKNMDDYRRDQLQQSLSRITSVSGSYTGSVISKIDGTNLGAITLKFQARTDIQSNNSTVSSEQNAIVSGSLNFKSLNSAEIVFDNGFYDDVTGDFQVTIPISNGTGNSSKLSLVGVVNGNNWNGTLEVKGQPDFGGELNLTKNAAIPNNSSIEIGGTRLQQINKLKYSYEGTYKADGNLIPFKLSFVNKDISPEQNFYKLFSPVRNVGVTCDFSYFDLNFTNAILDDKAGTLVGSDPYDQNGSQAHANLNCLRFDEDTRKNFGWDCVIQVKSTSFNLHLSAKK